MGCLVVILGIIFPRLVLAVGWFVDIFSATFWGVIGWIFMPYTTFAATVASTNGLGQDWTIVVIVAGMIVDFGFLAYKCSES